MSDPCQSTSDLQQMYRDRFLQSVGYRQGVWAVLARWFSAWVPAESVVLDLGCGYCEFINNIKSGRKFGIDLNPDSADRAAADVTLIQQDCSDAWPVPYASIDVIFTSNFLEHLPTKDHLDKTLRQAWLSLSQGGALIAMGPNIKYVPGAYWDFYDHHIPLTENSLVEVLKKCGFLIERSTGRFLPYTMGGKRTYPSWIVKAYLMLPLFWPLFGKQFLVIARKPGAT